MSHNDNIDALHDCMGIQSTCLWHAATPTCMHGNALMDLS